MTERVEFRLAFRTEGGWVKCYLAQPDSMEDAQLLGTVAKDVLDDEAFRSWVAFFDELIASRLKERGLGPGEFSITPAPAKKGH